MTDDPFAPWLERWNLTQDGAGFTSRLGQHLLPVRYRGMEAMLKIATDPEERRGAGLMRWYEGQGAARVFALEGEALLMERLVNEFDLAAMARDGEDDAATRI